MVVAVIGAGTMGSAVAKSLLRSGCEGRVIAADTRSERLRELEKAGVNVTGDNRMAAREAHVVILCVKPKDVANVLKEIQKEIKGKLVMSIAAAVSLDFLKKAAPETRFLRAMPNVAVLVQESFTAYCASLDATVEDKAVAERLLGALGKVVEVEEKLMDAITALSGCSPAYLSVIMEAMVRAGLEAGLPEDLALAASAQTMVGTGKLVLEAQIKPSIIKALVATPGGVTEEGLKELAKVSLEKAIISAVSVGAAKSKSMSQSLAGQEA